MSLKDRQALLFDLDGTLIDSGSDLAGSLNHTLSADGWPVLSRDGVLALLGDGAPVLIERAYRHYGSVPPADALARYREHYRRHCLTATRPYDGIPELLAELDGEKTLAVATNKPTDFAEQILDGLGLRHHFKAVLGPELAGGRKPSPVHVRATLDAIGHTPDEAVMIGDSPADVFAGRRAGTETVAVLWGYRNRRELTEAGADRFATGVDELAALLTT